MSRIDELLEADARVWRDDVNQDFGEIYWRRNQPRRAWPAVLAGGIVVTAAVAVAVVIARPAPGRITTPISYPRFDCAAPRLEVLGQTQPVALTRGRPVSVVGIYFVDGCQDSTPRSAGHPMGPVGLVLTTSDHRRHLLGTAQPRGSIGQFTLTVTVPASAVRGAASITDDLGGREAVAVTIS